MNFQANNSRSILTAMLVLVTVFIGCSNHEPTEKSFVGKWQSSRLSTPVYLNEFGEWKIQTDDGVVQQYGVWQFLDNKIMWSYKTDNHIGHDTNLILSVSPKEFTLRESDGSVTTFTRLE